MSDVTLICGDAAEALKELPAKSARCVVTSPPYFQTRTYGQSGEVGSESTPEEYITRLVKILHETANVLHQRGSLWLNVADGYYGGAPDRQPKDATSIVGRTALLAKVCEGCGKDFFGRPHRRFCSSRCGGGLNRKRSGFNRPKCLLAIPHRLIVALVDDGWVCRNDIIWSKENALGGTVQRDRVSCRHEHLFHLVKPGTYGGGKYDGSYTYAKSVMTVAGKNGRPKDIGDVWPVRTSPSRAGHPAPFPETLIDRCVLACTRPGDVVLDPFMGSGTVGRVARRHGRRFVGIDLQPRYVELARKRIAEVESEIGAT